VEAFPLQPKNPAESFKYFKVIPRGMSKEKETGQVFVIPSCHCQRCGHDWTIRKPERPKGNWGQVYFVCIIIIILI
jgi:hypothetical protein